MDLTIVVFMTALCIPIITILLFRMNMAQRRHNGYTSRLERRVQELEESLERCIKERIILKEQLHEYQSP